MNPDNVKTRIEKNEALPCSVQGCPNHRHRISTCCMAHAAMKQYWGHPKSRGLLRKELAVYRQEIDSVVTRNEETHAGLRNALEWFQRWLRDAAESRRGVPGAKQIRRLYAAGVSARDLLVLCGAVYLYQARNLHMLPNQDALRFQLAHQVMKSLPLECRTSGSGKRYSRKLTKPERKELGTYIDNSLGLLFHNMVSAVNQREERKKAFVNEQGRLLV
jgi:hypothetical protein